MKKIILLASLLLFTGCGAASIEGEQSGDSSSGITEKSASELVVGVSLSTLNNPFFISMQNGIENLAKEQDTTLKLLDAQDDTVKQSNDIDDLIQQKVDIILVNPVDSSAITPAVELANEANIPVITIDRVSEGGEVITTVASDNEEGGKMAAEFMLEKLGENAVIAELEGVPGASATRERGSGFDNFAEGKLTIIDKQSANFNRAEGLTVTENMFQAHGDIQGIFAQNDEMALGAVEAVASKNSEIVIVGFDGTDDGLEAIEKGDLAATIAQQPDEMGRLALQAAYDYFAGKEIPDRIPSPLELIQ